MITVSAVLPPRAKSALRSALEIEFLREWESVCSELRAAAMCLAEVCRWDTSAQHYQSTPAELNRLINAAELAHVTLAGANASFGFDGPGRPRPSEQALVMAAICYASTTQCREKLHCYCERNKPEAQQWLRGLVVAALAFAEDRRPRAFVPESSN